MDIDITSQSLISPKIHRYLYPFSIRRFLVQHFENVKELAKGYDLDLDDNMVYSHLLDAIIKDRSLEESEIDKFLIRELNYGRNKNVFVSFIQGTSHLEDERDVYEFINSLETKGYENAELVDKHPFVRDLRSGISNGQKKLIYFNVEKSDLFSVRNIEILLAKGVIDNNGEECNYYIGVEINLDLGMLIIKLRSWDDSTEESFGLDKLHKRIKAKISSAMKLSILPLTVTSQKIVYSMINDLSHKVLEKSMDLVNEKIGNDVELNINSWTESILSEDIKLPPKEVNVISHSILNNFYRLYVQNEIDSLSGNSLKEKFNVDGYARYIKFMDDTIGEGRAKSSDPAESLLDTSIYYDVKARLDQAKQIKLATVYWLNIAGYDKVGTTFYTDHQERFKFIVLINFFDKEICNYVLQKINEYRPT